MSKQQRRLNELMRLANIASAQDGQLNAMINLVSHRTASPVVTDASRDLEFNALLPGVAQRLKINEDLLSLLIENGVMLNDLAEQASGQEFEYIYKTISEHYQAQMLLVKFNNSDEDRQRIKNLALITEYDIKQKVNVFYNTPFCKLYFPAKAADDQYLQDLEAGRITPEQNFSTQFNTLLTILVVSSMIAAPAASIGYYVYGLIQESLLLIFSSLVGLVLITPIWELIGSELVNSLSTERCRYNADFETMQSNAKTRVNNLFNQFVKQVNVDDFVQAPNEQEIAKAKLISKPEPAVNNGNRDYSEFAKNVHVFFSNYPEKPNETRSIGAPPAYSPT